MAELCTKCGKELKEGKCVICKQRTISNSYLVLGIIFISISFILGIILGAVAPQTTTVVKGMVETESSFNWQLMLTTWMAGVVTFICYLAVYHLFKKLDCILVELKK